MIDIPDFIYPKDDQGNAVCPRCRKLVAQCDCPVLEKPKQKAAAVKPIIRLDKSGRKGKVVTVIENLPRNENYLKDLARQLKMKTGSGGTFYLSDGSGIVEIQGDHKGLINGYFKEQHGGI